MQDDLKERLRRIVKKPYSAKRGPPPCELQMLDRIEALTAEVERLREALAKIADGTMPRPLGEPWRMDMTSSKHDRCVHGAWMYEPCEGCIDAFIASVLGGANG